MIHGAEVIIKVDQETTLKDAAALAIAKTPYDSSRHVSEFQINMKNGPDNGNAKINMYNNAVIKEHIFLSLKAGVGA